MILMDCESGANLPSAGLLAARFTSQLGDSYGSILQLFYGGVVVDPLGPSQAFHQQNLKDIGAYRDEIWIVFLK